jgi:type II secretory pathway component GspD/PulD (secretin)
MILRECLRGGSRLTLFRASLLALTCSVCVLAVAKEHGITFNYRDTDIQTVTEVAGVVGKREYFLAADVHGWLTISCDSPISRDAFNFAFLQILELNGFGTEVSKDTVLISSKVGAGKYNQGAEIISSRSRSHIDVHIVTADKTSMKSITSLVRPLLSDRGSIVEYPSGRIVIISDTRENIQSIRKIIGKSSVPV